MLDAPLPTPETRKLYQDSDGYLWISTLSGLLRYDGYNCVVYKTDYNSHKQLLNSFVNLVSEDAEHNLWIGTHNGLYVLNKEFGLIEKVDFPILNYCRVEAIVSAKNGDMWIATSKGLFVRSHATGEFQYCIGDRWNVDPTDMKALLEDNNGFLWIGTWSDGLIRYDVKTRTVYKYAKIPALRSSHSLFMDRDDNIWIGTWGGGLVRLVNPYDMEKQEYVNYRHISGDTSSLLDDIIYTIAQEPNTGKIWVGSRSGLSILNHLETADFTNYVPGNNTNALPYNELNSIIATRDNIMWLSMVGGGVYYVDANKRYMNGDKLDAVRDAFGTSSVKAIYSDNKNEYWLSLQGFGLILYFRDSGTFVSYDKIPALQNLSQLANVNAISYIEETNELCIATEEGIVYYNRDNNHVKIVSNTQNGNFDDDCIYAFCKDSVGHFWIATRSGMGILQNQDKYVPLNDMLAPNQESMEPSIIFDMAIDANGDIYAATSNHGIYKIMNSRAGRCIKNYSMKNNVLPTEGGLCVHVDYMNRVWVGTEAGLMLYNASTDAFLPFESEKFTSIGVTIVNNIWEDVNKHLWIATNKGITELLIDETNSVELSGSYTVDDGLLDNYFHRNSSFCTSNGDVLLGGFHGINHISLNIQKKTEDQSSVVITDFKIFNKSLSEFDEKERNKISVQTIDYTRKIVLPYNKNNFSIEFSLLNYKNTLQNRYAYRLIGYDKNYVYADAKRHFAYYNNLPSGVYTFVVRAANSYDVWSSKDRILQIEILPPLWRTWWAYILYVLIGLACIYFAFRVIMNRVKMQKAIEIGEINRKKSEEINHAKLQFFTNITHELLTPLSIIIAAVDELRLSNPDTKEYGLITNNAMRLMRLIQQILEFRKAESGNLKLKVSEGNILSFVENCVVAFQPLATKQKINFTFKSDIKADIQGFFDPDKLDKVMYNLLSNAVKYNKENGSVKVNLNMDIDQSHIIITVEDTGSGISQVELKNLFQRFYDGDYRKHHTIGTGIGLSLVKNLVDIHHGSIEVKSVENSGTVFTVILPIKKSFYTAEEVEQISEIVIENMPLHNNNSESPTEEDIVISEETNVKLLIVEDNEDLLYLLQKYFRKNYIVFTAKKADEAICILEEKKSVDLIVSDIMMPGMNGYEFCSFVKNKFEYCHIPIILITAKQTVADKIQGYDVGADGYVTKPLNISVLEAKIKNLIQKRERVGIDYRKQLVFNAKELNYTTLDENFLNEAIECVNKYIDDSNFGLVQFVNEMNTSRTTLTDKLKKLTGLTPTSFISDIRLNAAYKLLKEKGKIRVSDLAYTVGFNDAKYFSTLFKKKFGFSPKDIHHEERE